MIKKFFSINLFLSLIFLLTTVFPASLFSYELTHSKTAYYQQDERVDESLGYKLVIFKKIRCPRCGMEFYYTPGKESPHSHWVHYEVPKEKQDNSDSRMEQSKNKKRRNTELGFLKEQVKAEEIKKRISKLEEREKDQSFSELEGFQQPEYELRQKLSCPYDGYNFFPEGDILEDRKLMQLAFTVEKPSVIETSFSKSIPFGASKELKQFGYDLFETLEAQEEKKEKETTQQSGGGALGALSLIKAAFSTGSVSPTLSFEGAAHTAVVPVSRDYIVGPGDTLVVNIWGSAQESFPVEVDREGKIMLPKAGPLYVWGLKLEENEKRIKKVLNKHYTNFSMDLSMGKLRDIQMWSIKEKRKTNTSSFQTRKMRITYRKRTYLWMLETFFINW